MVLQVEATGICSLLIFSDSFINHFAFDQCHYCWHKAIPRPYRGCTVSRIPPRWRINVCKGKKVFQHSLKSMEEISGDSKLLQESQTGSQNVLNPSTGLVSFTLFKKEEDYHCQSQIPTKYLQQANGVNLSDHKIRNRPDEGSKGSPVLTPSTVEPNLHFCHRKLELAVPPLALCALCFSQMTAGSP